MTVPGADHARVTAAERDADRRAAQAQQAGDTRPAQAGLFERAGMLSGARRLAPVTPGVAVNKFGPYAQTDGHIHRCVTLQQQGLHRPGPLRGAAGRVPGAGHHKAPWRASSAPSR